MAGRKIFTITANTAIDRVLIESTSRPASARTTTRSLDFPAGKGINAARTIASLGERVFALGFVGRLEKKFFRSLESPLLHLDLLPVRGKTRINVTAYNARERKLLHKRNRGYRVTKTDVRRLQDSVSNQTKIGDILVISGSLPIGAPPSTYTEIIRTCNEKGVISILDSSRDDLRRGIMGRPFMVKPNVDELEIYFGHRIRNSSANIAKYAQKLSEKGISLVVVSRGAKGLVVYSGPEGKAWSANVYVEWPVVPTGIIGAGDSLVAGFAVGLLRKWPITELIRFGIACGAAKTLSLGPGVCDRSDVLRILPRVHIRRIY